jgi:hypothetical protein
VTCLHRHFTSPLRMGVKSFCIDCDFSYISLFLIQSVQQLNHLCVYCVDTWGCSSFHSQRVVQLKWKQIPVLINVLPNPINIVLQQQRPFHACCTFWHSLSFSTYSFKNVTLIVAYKRASKITCLPGGPILAVSKIVMAIVSIHVLLQYHFMCIFVVTSEIYFCIWT